MKKLLIILSLFIGVSAYSEGTLANATYETWACPSWPCPTTSQTKLSTGTLNTTLNYDWGGGNVLDSGRSDYVVVHITASFVMPGTAGQSYTVYFLNQDDDGSLLKIGGTTVIDDWSGLHAPSNRGGSITLVGGQTYTYERWFSEWGGGAVMRQLWQIYGIHGSYVWMSAGSDLFIPAAAPAYPSYMSVGNNPGTISYGSSAAITTEQQTRYNAALGRRDAVGNNSIYIDQVGDNNSITVVQGTNKNELKGIGQQDASIQGNYNNITVRQGNTNGSTSGKSLIELKVAGDTNTVNLNQGYTITGTTVGTDSNNHYQMLNLTGNNNTVTTSQTDNNSSAPGHFMETTVSGNTNNITLRQKDSGGKVMFTNVNGNNNTVSALQDGLGAHYLETNLVGNGNSVTASQTGNIQNKASISITNAGGPGSVDLQQSGGANYNISTICVTAGGCGAVVIRQ